jgi:hypothetical protein
MHLPKELLTAAQEEDHACTRLVRAVELIAEFTPSLHKVGIQSHAHYVTLYYLLTVVFYGNNINLEVALVDQLTL